VRQFLMTNVIHRSERDAIMGLSEPVSPDSPDPWVFRINLSVLIESLEGFSDFVFPGTGVDVSPLRTLFVHGSKSGYVTSNDVKVTIPKYFPNSKVVAIEAGHWVHSGKRFLQSKRDVVSKLWAYRPCGRPFRKPNRICQGRVQLSQIKKRYCNFPGFLGSLMSDSGISQPTAAAVVQLDMAKHIKYFLACLKLLPGGYVAADTNRWVGFAPDVDSLWEWPGLVGALGATVQLMLLKDDPRVLLPVCARSFGSA
jgi:hypothetical protein